MEKLKNVPNIIFLRWLECFSESKIQLHAFADASRRAMAAVVYSGVGEPIYYVQTTIILTNTK